jgi:rhodanese-related sulfurtransferase
VALRNAPKGAKTRFDMDHSPRFLKLVEQARKGVREVSVRDVMERRTCGDAFRLIDVREDHEWAAGHIPGARHLGRGILERDIEKQTPDTDAEIVLYCGGGFRSALSAVTLQEMGYTRVFSMAGGWREWQAAGGAVEGSK